MCFAEEGFMNGQTALKSTSVLLMTFVTNRAFTVHSTHIPIIRHFNLIKANNSVILEAAHEFMSAHTVWTQELGAVGTARDCLLLGLAARALKHHFLNG